MKKRQFASLKKIAGIIADWVIFPIVLLAILFVVILSFSLSRTGIPSVGKTTFIKLMSSSMAESGYESGDVLIIRSEKSYNVGDDIAFYYALDPASPVPYSSPRKREFVTARKDIWFHRITRIIEDREGVMWYKTKGTSNQEEDIIWIRQDFVIGKNAGAPKAVTSVLTFLSSTSGILIVVVIPALVMILILSVQLVYESVLYSIERKFVRGKLTLAHEDIEKYRIINRLGKRDRLLAFENAPAELKSDYAKALELDDHEKNH